MSPRRPPAPANGQRPDRMPGPWKLVGSVLAALLAIVVWVFLTLNGAVSKNANDIVTVQAKVDQESKERAIDQGKTNVQLKGIEGKIERLEDNVKRIEEGQKETQKGVRDVLDELRQRGRTK